MPFKTSGLTRVYLVLSLLLLSSSLFAQTTFTGKIIGSSDKQPVPFATVQVKGERGATQTGTDGTFSIRVAKSSGTLVISAVGFETVQVPVNGSTAALGIITLNASTSTLNDIVVTGYTAQRKKDITGAVAVVNVADMKAVPGTSTEALLQGQSAGVTVINSGSPGGGSQILVRGITSIGNVDPLVIIDGVQSSMHDLNINDIESLQVLKDAGAVAIYGIQGSNGVVIITTKHGKSAKATISYDGFVGTQRPLKNGFGLGGSQQYADVLWLESYNDNPPVVPGNIYFGKGGATYAPPTLPAYLQPAPFINATGTPNPTYVADQNPSTYDIVNNQITKTNLTGTDWFHEIFKPAPWTQHTIAASAGSEKSSYYISLSYLDQEGTLINTYNKRYSARVNTTFAVKDHVRVGENLWVYFKQNPLLQAGNQNEGNSISLAYRIPPIIPVYDVMGNYAGTHAFLINNAGNPVAQQQRTANNLGNDVQINGNAFADVDFLKHFTIHTSFGGTFDNNYYYSFAATPYENAEGSTAPNSFNEGSAFNSTWVWTNTLAYNQTFGKISVKALAGTEAKEYNGRGLNGTEGSYFSTNPLYWTLSTGTPSTATTTSAADSYNGLPYHSSLYSQFGRVDLAWQDKYLLSGTVRRDESSIFAPGQRTGIFPSVSGAWRITGEDFMSGVTWLKDLKLRGSWGKSGNLSNVIPTNSYNLSSSSAFNSYYDIGGNSTSSTLGFYSSQLGNAVTTWENDILTDVGVDASIQHFDVTADYFQKKISGLLFLANLSSLAGGPTAPYVNFGDIKNTGVDFSIGYHTQVNRDFKFGVTVTGTHYVSKVTALPPGLAYYSVANAGSSRLPPFSRMQAGTAIGEFYGYKQIGYFQNAQDVAKSPTQNGAAPGAFKFADINKDGTIDQNDQTYIGNPNPKLTYGFNLNATYKNFDFFASFYGSYGNDIFNYVKYWTVFPEVFQGNVVKDLVANSWTPTNLNPKYPQITGTATFSNANEVNSWYIEKGSYLRLKSLNLGYTLDPVLLHRVGIDKVRIYVQGANLFTITKYTGLDPELQASNLGDQTNFGIDLGNYPANQKTFMVGLNVTF